MDTNTASQLATSIITRAKLVILSPKECWKTIASEQSDPQTLLKSLLIPLIALGALAQFLGLQIFGQPSPLGTWRPPLVSSLIFFLLQGVLQVVMLFVMAFVIEKLAPIFQGSATRNKAFSLIAHAALPGLVAGLLGIVPLLLALAIVFAVLGLYTFYQGIPSMTSVPESKRVMFTISYFVVIIVAGIVVSSVMALFMTSPMMPMLPMQ